MDFKKTNAETTTITRDVNKLDQKTGNVLFNNQSLSITAPEGVTFTDGVNTTTITPINIDTGNMSENPLPGTILLHRKKESNTLYTINALNALVRQLNNGMLDNRFIINWTPTI